MEQPQRNHPKTIAAIPGFNVGGFIGEVVASAAEHVDQVIVIDDGSSDDTARKASAAGAEVISHGVNQGAGEATKSCFRISREKKADILITLDGDGQHNPEEIPIVLAPILNGQADLVIGSRFLNQPDSIPRYRRFGIRVITWLVNFASPVKVSDSQSCYRAYSKKAIRSLSITERGFAFSIELLVQAKRKGLAITEVPISCVYHSASHSLNPVVHGVGVALSVVRLRAASFMGRLGG